MAIRTKSVVTYRTTAECPKHARTEIPIRDLNVTIDELLVWGNWRRWAQRRQNAVRLRSYSKLQERI